MNNELLGYIASAILFVSYLTNNMIKLRIINTVACTLFLIYGVLIDAMPVVIVNVMVLVVNAFYIIKKFVFKK